MLIGLGLTRIISYLYDHMIVLSDVHWQLRPSRKDKSHIVLYNTSVPTIPLNALFVMCSTKATPAPDGFNSILGTQLHTLSIGSSALRTLSWHKKANKIFAKFQCTPQSIPAFQQPFFGAFAIRPETLYFHCEEQNVSFIIFLRNVK